VKHKIAIIKNRIHEYYDSDGYNYDKKIVDSITEWEEVEHEVFAELSRASGKLGFTIIEQPTEPKEFIAKSIADYRALIVQEEARLAAMRADREKKALERKHKKELKDVASKKKLFEQLRKELGE
jgi:hypothetical protein